MSLISEGFRPEKRFVAQPPSLAQPGQQQQATSLYIKNLPPEADKLYLYEHFARFGGISSVKVASIIADPCAF